LNINNSILSSLKTGLPFPDQVVSAADTVMKFAVDKLGFKTEDIIIFAWSIGGYPSSWMAQQYPSIDGLILDATFDDVVPLAVAKMPASWKPIVVNTGENSF
jgi:pimeloyl-ACP methyl ester carboxylesterase